MSPVWVPDPNLEQERAKLEQERAKVDRERARADESNLKAAESIREVARRLLAQGLDRSAVVSATGLQAERYRFGTEAELDHL